MAGEPDPKPSSRSKGLRGARNKKEEGVTEAPAAAAAPTSDDEVDLSGAAAPAAAATDGAAAPAAPAEPKAKPAPRPKRVPMSIEQAQAEMEKHRAGYNEYQKERAAGNKEGQEKHRPAYTAFKRAYGDLLAQRGPTRGKTEIGRAHV